MSSISFCDSLLLAVSIGTLTEKVVSGFLKTKLWKDLAIAGMKRT